MRLVHLSDLHLGFRQFQRLTPGGINQREADVAQAFRHAVDSILELSPDLVLIAGDVFHNVRPGNPAILHAFNQFARLAQGLPGVPIIIIAGNHDTPRAAETGCILRLFRQLGAHVVDAAPERLRFPERDLSVLAVPNVFGAPRTALVPDPGSRYNVLLIHAPLLEVLPAHAIPMDRAVVQYDAEDVTRGGWDYVALGHYHIYREIAPNAYYSGSTEYISVWSELYEESGSGAQGKGFIERDLKTGEHVFHRIPLARRMIELDPISARGRTVAELDDAIRAAVDSCVPPIDNQVVRLLIRDLARHIFRELDHKALREYKRRALHFQVDTRRPELLRLHGSGSPGRRPSVAEVVREKLRARLLPGDVSRDSLIALAGIYLDKAEQAETSIATPDAGSG